MSNAVKSFVLLIVCASGAGFAVAWLEPTPLGAVMIGLGFGSAGALLALILGWMPRGVGR